MMGDDVIEDEMEEEVAPEATEEEIQESADEEEIPRIQQMTKMKHLKKALS